MANSADAVAELRSNWKFPAVVHFCRVFEGVLSLRQFSSDKFEAALLNPGDHSVFLSELISRLLYPGRKKNALNPKTWPTWETNLLKKVTAQWTLTMDHDPLEGQRHFVEVSPLDKLEILYLLTEIALQTSTNVRDTIRNTVEDPQLTADSVRCLPIGEDAEGDKYFLFSLRYEDCRLYKQRLLKSKTEGESNLLEWFTLTTTLAELKACIMELKRSKHPAEKKLHRYLFGILPEFEHTERHRKRMEDRAALREQAPLLKRSSRLQEQARRKEKERRKKSKDQDMGDVRNDDVVDDKPALLNLGISRAERMRLRNQRRELAERGPRRVLTGKKRSLEYDGLTPLGGSIQTQRKKRNQTVRPSRNITKLVSIIWEKFRRPMHHRMQFEGRIETEKKRRESLQGRNEVLSRLGLNQRPLEVRIEAKGKLLNDHAQGLVGTRDARLTPDAYRPGIIRPSGVLGYGQQRPMPGYSFGSLQMPRPLQAGTDVTTPTLSPALQHRIARYPNHMTNRGLNMSMVPHPPALTDSLRRHVMQQPRQYDLDNRHSIIPQLHYEQVSPSMTLTGRQTQQPQMGWRDPTRTPALLQGYSQRLPEQSYMRGLVPFPGQEVRYGGPPVHGMQDYASPLRNVRQHLVPNQLTRSLVQYPVSLNSAMKAQWTPRVPSNGNSNLEMPKMPYGRSYFYSSQLHPRDATEIVRPNLQSYPYQHPRWPQTPSPPDNGNRSTQDPTKHFPPLFLRGQRND